MNKHNSKIPAFPRPEAWTSNPEFGTQPAQEGMSLRDYFAAKAMAAIIVASDGYSNSIGEIDEWLGKYAYAAADVMLKARKE